MEKKVCRANMQRRLVSFCHGSKPTLDIYDDTIFCQVSVSLFMLALPLSNSRIDFTHIHIQYSLEILSAPIFEPVVPCLSFVSTE